MYFLKALCMKAQSVCLSDICKTIFLGRPPLPREQVFHGAPNAIGLRALDVSGHLDLNNLDHVHVPYESDLSQTITSGDVLLAVRGSLGKAALVTETLPSPLYITSNLAALRPEPSQMNPFYLWLWLQSLLKRGTPEFKRYTTGQQSIGLGDLKKMQVPVIPLPEQRQIQSVVESLLKFRKNQRDQASKLEELFGSVLRDVFPHE